MKLPRFFEGKDVAEESRDTILVPPENVLSLRKNSDFKLEINLTHIKNFFLKHRILTESILVLIVVTILFLFAFKGKASIVNFYPETCLGGWENPSNTEGQPSVASDAQGSDFTRDNSAFLKNRAAQMFCGDFGGEVPDDSVPRKFTVRFSWFVDDGSYDKGEKIINEKLDEGRNAQTQTEENEDTDSVNSESDENSGDISDSQTDSSADENTDDSSIPSNEDGSSDLPSGEMPQENNSTNEESSDPSGSDNSGSESSSSDDSSGSEGGSSESTSDSSSSDGDGGSSDSGGSDSSGGGESSSGGESAFFERFITKVFAQETESPAPQSEQQSEPTQEEVSEPAKEEDTSEETPEAPIEEITEPVEVEVPSEDNGAIESESSSESENDAGLSDENIESENKELESNGIVSLDETARDDLFRVMYTLDGTNWEELGIVKRNDWKNVEFDIPFSSVDSWEKLSKVQIAIESLPTIDSFPETFLDSVWVSVEYEGINPDPLPQPDFLTDKVLNDIRYENVRVIKILKPDGEYQIWYAFVPPSLLVAVDGSVGNEEIIKSGDTSLQIIDASTVPEYDPLIGPLPQSSNSGEEIETTNNEEESLQDTEKLPAEVLGDSIAVAEEVENIDESVSKEDVPSSVMTENITEINKTEVTNTIETNTTETPEQNEVKPFESVLDFVIGNDSDEKTTDIETDVSEKSQESEKANKSEEVVLNEEIIKEEGDPTDLRELNQPEWRWDLVARGKEVHPEYDIAVDNFKLFWITQTGDSFNMFGLDSSGTYSGVYFGQGEQVGVMTFITPTGTARFARFNRDTKKFMFSDE